jgi:hypothetical protein
VVDLKAYYAENRRRGEIADQEFAARTHGWVFGLSPDAAAWAARWASASPSGRTVSPEGLTRLVPAADRAGMLLKPEPGEIRSAFSSRDPLTEETTGDGFGFWPASAQYLVVHASATVAYADLVSMSALDILQAVIAGFDVPRARYRQA